VTVTCAPYMLLSLLPAFTISLLQASFSFYDSTAPSGSRTPHCSGFEITFRHTTLGRLLRASVTQHAYETDIHARGGIRTRIPGKGAAADLRLRPRGHWARLYRSCIRFRDSWNSICLLFFYTNIR
jgi:hypothetical protein